MAQTQARPWWQDVEHLRDDLEQRRVDRRQADRDNLAARRAARTRRRDELEAARESTRTPSADAVPRRRFDRGDTHDPAPQGGQTSMRDFEEALEAPPAPGERRTVQITGRTVPAPPTSTERSMDVRSGTVDRRRPPRRVVDRVGARPDRVAFWALMMGLLLILVAVGTADASTL